MRKKGSKTAIQKRNKRLRGRRKEGDRVEKLKRGGETHPKRDEREREREREETVKG